MPGEHDQEASFPISQADACGHRIASRPYCNHAMPWL